ncbi:hypothetical protein [Spiroplasma poulsonii]|uniref:hypothetical protein n=1 Tax=Spiroplasma poulsonii TaxID=2138 RepID=UPI000F8E0D14|nr:hypothetical protein [Spiroplasma poulsonii]
MPELVWLGFNYTCGIAFTSVYATMMFSEVDKTGQFLGMHMIWIFLVEGLVAGTCAWAFNLISYHKYTPLGMVLVIFMFEQILENFEDD